MALTQISTAGVKDDAVTSGKIPANAVGSSELADNAVDTAAIADDAVTNAKMADDAIGVAQLSASGTASSSTFLRGDNSWTTVNTDLVGDTSPQLGGDLDSNGNNIKITDGEELRLGDGNDLVIKHDGSHSYINDNGTGNLYLSVGGSFYIQNQAQDEALAIFNENGSCDFYYDNSKKFETTSYGLLMNGDAHWQDNQKIRMGATQDLELHHSSNANYINAQNGNLNIQRSGTTSLGLDGNGDIFIPDSKTLYFGDGADLQLYHNGSDSYVKNTGGDLYIRDTNGNIYIQPKTDENAIKCFADGAVELYHNNTKKFETTASGVTIDGHLTVGTATLYNTGNLLLGDSDEIRFGAGEDLQIYHDGSNSKIINSYGRLHLENTNGIIRTNTDSGFYIQSADGNTTHAEIDSDGLKFNGDTAAANALDDYEEGTWTPVVAGWDTFSPYSGSTYYAGWYTKIGNLIHVGWKIYIQNLTTVSSSAHIRIQGLPFSAKSVSAGPVAAPVRFDIPEFGMSGYNLTYMAGNDQTIYMYKHVNGGNNLVAMNAAANRSNVWTMGTATYLTN